MVNVLIHAGTKLLSEKIDILLRVPNRNIKFRCEIRQKKTYKDTLE